MGLIARGVRWLKETARIFLRLENIFAVSIVLTVALIIYFAPYKLAFLNFYYLPILLAGYLLGARSAALGSILCAILVTTYVLLVPEAFFVPQGDVDILMNIVTWAAFLFLTSGVVGTLYEKAQKQLNELSSSYERERNLNETIQRDQEALRHMYGDMEAKNRTIQELKDQMEQALNAAMDPVVAKLWVGGRLRDEKRRVSVFFSDLTNYTGYSEQHEPEEVIEELNLYFAAMEEIISQYRGHVDKFIGDGIMCEFGAPINYETHSLQATLAALKMQDCLKARGYPWQMRIGISTGNAISGLIGSKRRSFTTIGNVVNVAARLEQLCEPGGILVDEGTFLKIDPWIETQRKRNLIKFKRTRDVELMDRLHHLEDELKCAPKDFKLLFEAGNICFSLRLASQAIQFYEGALAVDRTSTEVKLAYAEAMLHRDEFEKIEIKGKQERVAAYEVIGLRDPLADAVKIPASLAHQYREKLQQLKPYEDAILPVEALDGTIGHSSVVALLAYSVAERLNMESDERDKLLLAAYLHDLGHSMIPHHILTLAGKLLDLEAEEIKKHPLQSVELLTEMGITDAQMLAMVGDHHEAMNGRGYPQGKGGESISLGARIIAVADCYDALTAWRPYRERLTPHVALNEIRKDTTLGKYDPRVVDAMASLLEGV